MVDNRAMKIEVVVDPSKKSLAERVGPINKPAPQPKAAAAKPKPAGRQPQNKDAKKGGKRGGAKPNNRKPKTAEELDAEMVDYFGSNEQAAAPAAAPAPAAAAAPDTNMDEEVL